MARILNQRVNHPELVAGEIHSLSLPRCDKALVIQVQITDFNDCLFIGAGVKEFRFDEIGRQPGLPASGAHVFGDVVIGTHSRPLTISKSLSRAIEENYWHGFGPGSQPLAQEQLHLLVHRRVQYR